MLHLQLRSALYSNVGGKVFRKGERSLRRSQGHVRSKILTRRLETRAVASAPESERTSKSDIPPGNIFKRLKTRNHPQD